MGNLVGEHVRLIYGEPKGTSTPSVPEDIPWISYSFKFKTEESFVVQRSSALAKIVEERNKLIHIKFLDEQNAFLASEYEYVKQVCEAMIDLGEEAILELRKQLLGKRE